ncbi:GLRK-like protein [Mya arenaria]|uniref:GLRK-like protein n=1 Tax=Mya arenaria TaxID=6604 RepID=A0ABY7DMS6_MYAAR|nr:GLRK-like protein [Mya arenaria]
MDLLGRFNFVELVYLFSFLCSLVNAITDYPIGAIFDRNSEDIKYAFNKEIEFLNTRNDAIHIVPEIQELDATDSFAKNDTSVLNHKFHFLLGELRIDEMNLAPFRNGGINITGFQLLNYTKLKDDVTKTEWMKWQWPDLRDAVKIPLGPALVIDAVQLFQKALKKYNKQRSVGFSYNNYGRSFSPEPRMKCTDSSNYISPHNGSEIMKILKSKDVQIDGLSGKISFDERGFRDKFQIQLFDITMTMGLADVGYWTPDDGLRTQEPYKRQLHVESTNRTRIVTTIMEAPYLMYKDAAAERRAKTMPKPVCGRELFTGFCMDLADAVSRELNIKFNVCLVKDGKYGEELENGTWNGLLGEVLRQEAPYVMYKDAETERLKPRCGNHNFVGYCVDIAKRVSEIVGFDYEICRVKDGNYGEKLENETWNGIIGELTRDEVDLAIAPLTINSQRERVVDFTKPFMSLGISIMIKKTAVKKASVFSFMDPLSYEIWMCILFAYIGVNLWPYCRECVVVLHPHYHLLLHCQPGSLSHSGTNNSKFPVYERMWAYMQSASPSVFCKTNDDALARVRKGNYAYFIESNTNDYINMREPCDTMKDGGQAELTLENVAGIFYILVAGLILSIVIACVEFFYKSKLDSKRSKKSFGAMLRCKARLSFRGSLDRDTPAPSTPMRKSMSTYTYTGPTQVSAADGFPDNLHTQV